LNQARLADLCLGANWQDYSRLIDQEQIDASGAHGHLVGSDNIAGRSFDIGCGPGCTAWRLSWVRRAEAIDYDPLSVATTTAVLEKFWDAGRYRV
jgi:hypothetical protein